ncbi:MAG: TetR/AcrR family transcriptional regulator [Elusimicrobia bacterium]|nr:TetR/AcrR family transcriptional regulator [Elusimicrobiota bacterium]
MDRKSEILGLADELVKSVGYESFSYADLSAKLGIAKASIHHHFPHKEDLGVALCESYLQAFRDKAALIEDGPGTAWEKIERYLGVGAALVEDNRKNCPVAALQAQVNVLPEPVRAKLKELDQIELDFFSRVLEGGRARGELTFKGDSSAQAALVLAAYKGALAFARVHGCAFFRSAMGQLKRMVGV